METRAAPESAVENYSAISTLAIGSAALAVVSLVALLDVTLAVVPLFAMLVAARALYRIKTSEGLLTGRPLAAGALGLAGLSFVASIGLSAYEYLTEVPQGYKRAAFADFKPAADAPQNESPPEAKALDGQRVFIKGYMRPGAQSEKLEEFLLVRDNGVCCFGTTMPSPWDMVHVKFADGLTIDYDTRLHKIAGTLRIDEIPAQDGTTQMGYHLDADYSG